MSPSDPRAHSLNCHLSLGPFVGLEGRPPSLQSLGLLNSYRKRPSAMLPLSTFVTNMPQSPGKQGSFTPSAISNPSDFKSMPSCQNSSSTLYKAAMRNTWPFNPKPLTTMWGLSLPHDGQALGPQDAVCPSQPRRHMAAPAFPLGALLLPRPSEHCDSIHHVTDQPATTQLGQAQGKDASHPKRKRRTSKPVAVKLGEAA